jgi:hypothetical protein
MSLDDYQALVNARRQCMWGLIWFAVLMVFMILVSKRRRA